MAVPHDQRFHNYLLYTGQFERVRLLRAGNAEVYNMGYLGRKVSSPPVSRTTVFDWTRQMTRRTSRRVLVPPFISGGVGGRGPLL